MISNEKIASLPTSAGVYQMKGANGDILYVGKARNLRQRVRSYFVNSRDSRYQVRFLVELVVDIECIVTDTEKEALILENTLIKRYRPKYNINLRDDKTYFSLRLDMKEKFPRLTVVRKVANDNASYYGPYASATAARSVLRQLQRIFPLRHYPLEICNRRKRPCLFYQIGQCSGPCHGLISEEEYLSLAEGVALFLSGKDRDLVKKYRQKMATAAITERYEEAARYRDIIHAIETTLERQKMVTQGGDMDVVGIYREENTLTLAMLFLRGGTLVGSRNYSFSWGLDDAEAVASFLGEYYGGDVFVPSELLLPLAIPDNIGLAELLAEKKDKKVAISVPRRGIKLELVALAARNAETAAIEHRDQQGSSIRLLQELKDRLHLSRFPIRIECYDISTFQGKQSVGSRVTFVNGRPFKGGYRRYRIKNDGQTDDFGMLTEVLTRRAKRASDDPLPDLLIVDGGLGQLGVLTRVLDDLQLHGIETAALAKSRVFSDMADSEITRSTERVFRPGRKNPIILKQNSRPLLLLTQIRDEAHRFAISYHTQIRDKETLHSVLEDIPGIGRLLSRRLLLKFGSLARISEATTKEFTALPGVSEKLAAVIFAHVAKIRS